MEKEKGIDWTKDNIYDAINRPDLKSSMEETDLKDAQKAVIDAKIDFEEAKKWYISRIDAYDELKANLKTL